jgi:hypothetical protein
MPQLPAHLAGNGAATDLQRDANGSTIMWRVDPGCLFFWLHCCWHPLSSGASHPNISGIRLSPIHSTYVSIWARICILHIHMHAVAKKTSLSGHIYGYPFYNAGERGMYFESPQSDIHFFSCETDMPMWRERNIYIQPTSKMYSPLEIGTCKPTIHFLSPIQIATIHSGNRWCGLGSA